MVLSCYWCGAVGFGCGFVGFVVGFAWLAVLVCFRGFPCFVVTWFCGWFGLWLVRIGYLFGWF